jgi:putative copper export protein/mono/diheme cytochrome c family protein
MDAVDIALSAVRGVHVAASLSAFGVLLLWSAVLPPGRSGPALGPIDVRLRRLFRLSLACAFAAAVVWILLEAMVMADAASLGETLSALWPVLRETRFGNVLILRLALLALAALLLGRGARRERRAGGALVAGLSLVPHAWLAHAGATAGTDGVILLGAETLHVLAAGAWVGSLAPLFIALGALAPGPALQACRRYSWLGLVCVVILAATALAQGWILIGGLPGLVGTSYGRVALLKLALFLSMLGLAAANRFRHAPALGGGDGAVARRRLRSSVAIEAATGLLVVLAAAFLADLTPALHEQPVWPFTWRPSLEALGDADLGRVAASGLLGLGAAVLLVVIGLVWRHLLPFLLAGAALVLIWALPDLRLFFVDAYPTSFYQSPTGFAAQAIARGAALYPIHCAACHGAEGKGDGPAAKSLPIPPADLTAPHLWAHGDGELFWWLAQGIEAPQGGLAMPGFADRLAEDERWALIDYVRARNAGLAWAATGQWPQPVQAPGIQLHCPGGQAGSLGALRGSILRIVILPSGRPAPAPAAPATDVWVTADPRLRPGPARCIADDPAAAAAYAIIGGIAPGDPAGAQFLVDAQGWLRTGWHPGEPAGWTEPRALSTMIAEIRTNPIAASAGHGHRH